jgi:hypothetical protein
MLDLTKPVRMKSGVPVKILSTHLMGSYPILGQTQGEYCVWKRDGSCLPDGYALEDDLENVPEERKVWLNVYEDVTRCHSDREEADMAACSGRIARVKIILRGVEGRYDE